MAKVVRIASAESLQPAKFDPRNPEQREAREDAFMKYRSIAGSNPYQAKSSYRDELRSRECRKPEANNHDMTSSQHRVLVVEHPALRDKASRQALSDAVLDVMQSSTDHSVQTHRRTASHPSPKTSTSEGFRKPGARPNHAFSKSASDNDVLRPKVSQLLVSRDGSPHKRKISPSPLTNLLPSPSKQALGTIDEQEDLARGYKVEVNEPGSHEKVIRSPLKKLFGDKGILGKTLSSTDFSDSGSKKTGFAHWGGKVKARVDDMTRDLSERLQALESPHKRPCPGSGPSKFSVSLSPYVQGDFYMQLELLLNIETNNFLMLEIDSGRISISSLKSITDQWRNKGRPQVLGCRYDLNTQRELVGMNTDTIHFSGINAFSRQRLFGVLAAWKVLAREISIRTFCQPDSAVKKHLFDAEKVLEIINASSDSMLAFQELRSRVITEIYKEERIEAERKMYHGVERPWSPSKKRF